MVTEKQFYDTRYASNFIETGAKNFEIVENETKVVESVTVKSARQILNTYSDGLSSQFGLSTGKILDAMETYASQFKNTDVVKVITDRIAELGKLLPESRREMVELKNILKLIQP